MPDNETETVAVPVELLRHVLADTTIAPNYQTSLEAFIPKPKPRLVAFNYHACRHTPVDLEEYWDAQPDLLATLDDVIDQRAGVFIRTDHRNELKSAIRTALGVEA